MHELKVLSLAPPPPCHPTLLVSVQLFSTQFAAPPPICHAQLFANVHLVRVDQDAPPPLPLPATLLERTQNLSVPENAPPVSLHALQPQTTQLVDRKSTRL